MEGYFPICKYCEITGVKKNTAHRRAERGSVESFKNSEGRWFLYYCDDKEDYDVPEGYITCKEFAKKHRFSNNTLERYIRHGFIDRNNCIVLKRNIKSAVVKGSGKRKFIKENAEIKKPKHISIVEYFRPSEDWLTVDEWCKKENIKEKHYVYFWMNSGLLSSAYNKKHRYIPKTETVETIYQRKTQRRKDKKEWLQRQKQQMQQSTGMRSNGQQK